jgi:hypothetical protein
MNRPRVALVTALLPPTVGGTEVLVWRLFRGDPALVVISGAPPASPASLAGDGSYRPLDAPTLSVPYPRLRGYRYGLAPLLGGASAAWLVATLPRVIRFLREAGVEQVVSIPHHGPFAVLGYLAALRLGLRHTFYILDPWEEASTGPLELKMIRATLRHAARSGRSRLAVVSPVLGEHYRRTFGFQQPIWVPNPAPLPDELPSGNVPSRPIVLFTGGIKSFNEEAVSSVARAIGQCRTAQGFVITGNGAAFVDQLKSKGTPVDRVRFVSGTRQEIARLQRESAVLLIATNAHDSSETTRGYLPGRLPEYVASGRPVLVLGRQDSDAARSVRHWGIGRTAATRDETELAGVLDQLTAEGLADSPERDRHRSLFLEVFARAEARHRLLGDPAPQLSDSAAALARSFEDLSTAL